MGTYETMFVINPELDDENTKGIVERIVDLVNSNDGEVTDLDAWGRRRLAYEIKGFREGFYILMHYNAPENFNVELERIFRINENVIRYLIVKHEA